MVVLLGPAAGVSSLAPACPQDAALAVLAPPATSPPATVVAAPAVGVAMVVVPAAVATVSATVPVVAVTVMNRDQP